MTKHFSCVENLLDFINNVDDVDVVVDIEGKDYWLTKNGDAISLEVYGEDRIMCDYEEECTYDMIEGIFDAVKDGYFEVLDKTLID